MKWKGREKEYARLYYQEHKEKLREYQRDYAKANKKTVYEGHTGPCVCPKCGKRGYGDLRRVKNVKTGVSYANAFLTVRHHHTDGKTRKTVYDGACYIGVIH